jgi:predicted metal-binding membrane protein
LELRFSQRVVILAALAAVVALAWLYLFVAEADMSGAMAGMDRAMAMPPRRPLELLVLLAMWWVMMAGMMLPSAAPVLLTFANVNRSKRARGEPYVPTALFSAGYLLTWGGFSIAATLGQWALESTTLLSPMDMAVNSRVLGGLLLLAAGLYQFTPVKYACLNACRSPLDFVLNHWRDGRSGALRMGMAHGASCLGCCWILMLLLFVGGVMNLLVVAGLAVVVLVEKLVPGPWFGRIVGVLLVAGGAWLLATI